MRIFVVLTVRDEGDIIAETLQGFLEWADELFVYDNGSLDNTWEVIEDFSRKYKGRITARREEVLFTDSLRGYVFALFRERFRNGDWICVADADEIYHISPRVFLTTQCEPHENVVYMQYYNFLFTTDHLQLWLSGKVDLSDRLKSLSERFRHYMVGIHPGEPRIFRYRSSMKWLANNGTPRDAGIIAKNKIPVRHYPFRDPPQMIRRATLRKLMITNEPGKWTGSHWRLNWFDYITPSDSKGVSYWEPGTDLSLVQKNDHLLPARSTKEKITRLLHRLNLIVLKDMFRSRPDLVALQPSPLSEVFRQQLNEQLSKVVEWRSELPPHLMPAKP